MQRSSACWGGGRNIRGCAHFRRIAIQIKDHSFCFKEHVPANLLLALVAVRHAHAIVGPSAGANVLVDEERK